MADKVSHVFRIAPIAQAEFYKWRAAVVFWNGERRDLQFVSGRVWGEMVSRAIRDRQDAVGAALGAMTGGENIREQWHYDLSRDEARERLESWLAKCKREGLSLAVKWES